MIGALRFFQLADRPPMWMLLLSLLAGAYATAIIVIDPLAVDEALAIVLLWQMFAAAAGFARRASAGHFDAALVRWPRRVVALAHGFHAIAPGMCLWMLIAAVDAVVARHMPTALEPGRLAAFAFVSVVSWALALPSARFVTGALWLILIVAAATTRFGVEQYAAMTARPEGSVASAAHASVLVAVCPFLMLGDHVPPRSEAAVALGAAMLAAAAGGVFYIARRDYALEPSL